MSSQTASTPLVIILSLLGAGAVFTLKASAAPTPPVADVYVQIGDGVYVYTANAAGKLTALAGSPFADTGQMEAVNGSNFLISVGTDYLHIYKIESNGAVGGQLSEIDTQSYGGGDCGTTEAASLLDHTGRYFSVALAGSSDCSALQTYKVATNGDFTFLGDSVSTSGYQSGVYPVEASTYSSNDLFAYGVQGQQGANVFLPYKRGSAGDLVVDSGFTQTGPTPSASDNTSYAPVLVAADPASHLAAVMNQPFGPDADTFQLASYTISSTGAVKSTNTYANMPVLEVYPDRIAMSPAGNFAAVGGSPGLQIFHFNGASPATADGGVLLSKVEIDQVAWDKSNHLYALSYPSGDLYVYTVTSTGITEAAGSPYKVPGPYGLTGIVVVPK